MFFPYFLFFYVSSERSLDTSPQFPQFSGEGFPFIPWSHQISCLKLLNTSFKVNLKGIHRRAPLTTTSAIGPCHSKDISSHIPFTTWLASMRPHDLQYHHFCWLAGLMWDMTQILVLIPLLLWHNWRKPLCLYGSENPIMVENVAHIWASCWVWALRIW